MGFIEKLRQEKEARERAEAERRRLERERREITERECEQQVLADKQRHEVRRKQAEQFRNESGISTLIEELRTLIPGSNKYPGKWPFIRQSDEDSICDKVVWNIKISERHEHTGNYIVSETLPDGTIKVHGGFLDSSGIPRNIWSSNKAVLESALEKAYRHPGVYKWRSTASYDSGSNVGPCLPGDVLISTPISSLPIKNLKVGDFVWTTDKSGRKIKARIIQKCKRVVPKNHKIAHLVLKDGREVFGSAYHPIIDGRPIVSLKRGQFFDGSFVSSISLIPYNGQYTYDILPEGDTGGYWANNILLGSTLFNKFELFVTSNTTSATEIAFYMHTYAFFRPRQ